jgi:hypothetical protein
MRHNAAPATDFDINIQEPDVMHITISALLIFLLLFRPSNTVNELCRFETYLNGSSID